MAIKLNMKTNDKDTFMLLLLLTTTILIELLIFMYAFNYVFPKMTSGKIKPITLVEAACLLIVSGMLFNQCKKVVM